MMSDFLNNKKVYFNCLMTWHVELLSLNECRMDKLTQKDLHEPPNLNVKLNKCKLVQKRGL